MNAPARMLFFLRSHNDVDHVVPVIDRLLADGGCEVTVAILTRRVLKDDGRVALLSDRCRVEHVRDLVPDGAGLERDRAALPDGKRGLWCLAINDMQTEGLLDRVFGPKGSTGGGVVVFDWIMDSMPERPFVERIARACRERSLGLVALPHGDAPYSSRLFRPEAVDRESADNFSFSAIFDAVAVPNVWCQRRYTPHMPAERVPVLGSPRYCSDWIARLDGLVPEYAPTPADPEPSDGMLRAVLMPRSPAWHKDWTEFDRLLRVVRSAGGVRLAIKHHTRAGELNWLRREHPDLFACDDVVVQVEEDVSSYALCRWADVVMHTGTSAVTDAIVMRKGVISLEHMCHAKTLTAEDLPGTIALDRDGVVDRLERLARDRRDVGYNDAERARYLSRNVHPAGEDVLGRYSTFLRAHAQAETPSAPVVRVRSGTAGTAVVIPARMGSSRFPGKPMAPIQGIPLVGHCVLRAARCDTVTLVCVATCDEVIARYAESIGVRAVMTSDRHERASDRVAEAVDTLEREGQSIQTVVMLQGDEPLVSPAMIEAALEPMHTDPSVEIVNLAAPIRDGSEFHDRNEIKVVMNPAGDAMSMSRLPMPSSPAPDWPADVLGWKQVCVIPFRRHALSEFTALAPTPLEQAESIDMLRWMEHGRHVRMVPIDAGTRSVDTKEELAAVEAQMASDELFMQYRSVTDAAP